jgi:hypothetical protein
MRRDPTKVFDLIRYVHSSYHKKAGTEGTDGHARFPVAPRSNTLILVNGCFLFNGMVQSQFISYNQTETVQQRPAVYPLVA